MHRLYSISPAFFLSVFIHSILLFILLVTLAQHRYNKKKSQHTQRNTLQMRQPQKKQQNPTTPPPTKKAQALSTTNNQQSVNSATHQPTPRPKQHEEQRAQPAATPSSRQQQTTTAESQAFKAPMQKSTHASPTAQPSTASAKTRHTWHKYQQRENQSPPSDRASSDQPTSLNQLFRAGLDGVQTTSPKKSANERAAEAIAQSFTNDRLAEYKQEIARALLYALNRPRIIATPSNQPPNIVFSITITRKGVIHSPQLIHADITSSAMRKFVDDVITALCYVAPIRQFPPQVAEEELTLSFSIVHLGPKNNPYADNVPVVTRFSLSSSPF